MGASKENRLEATEAKRFHVERLLTALEDGRLWEYTGECFDAGPGVMSSFNPPRCACGHIIRYQFEIVRKDDASRKIMLGSECINYFESVNPELYGALRQAEESLKQKIAADKKAAAEALASAEVKELRAEIEAKMRTRFASVYREDEVWLAEDEERRSRTHSYYSYYRPYRRISEERHARSVIRKKIRSSETLLSVRTQAKRLRSILALLEAE